MAFPSTAIDIGEVGRRTVLEMAAVRFICADLQSSSASGPLLLSKLNGAIAGLDRHRTALATLEAKVQTSDLQALRTWATGNLRLSDGTAYAGDYVADYVAARNAIDAFTTWLAEQFPLAQNLIYQPGEEVNIIVSEPWATASAPAVALRSNLQSVLDAIAV